MVLFACSCEMKIQSQIYQMESLIKSHKMVSLIDKKSEGKWINLKKMKAALYVNLLNNTHCNKYLFSYFIQKEVNTINHLAIRV